MCNLNLKWNVSPLPPTYQRLKEIVNTGNCLTTKHLDWSECYEFSPGSSTKLPSNSVVTFDSLHNDLRLLRGGQSKSLGSFNSLEFSSAEEWDFALVYSMIFKPANQVIHRLPRQLVGFKTIIERFATEQFTNSLYAKSKVGFLTYRRLPIEANIKLLGQNVWHVHKPQQDQFSGRIAEICNEDYQVYKNFRHGLSKNMIMHECVISDICPTMVQTKENPNDVQLDIVHTADGYVSKNPPLYFRQIGRYEAVASNSYTFHCAATPKQDLIGMTRNFLYLAYAATDVTENQFCYKSNPH